MADTVPCDDVEGSSPVVVKEDEISNSSIVSSNRSVEMLDDEKIELEPGASDSSAQQSGEQSEAVAAGKSIRIVWKGAGREYHYNRSFQQRLESGNFHASC